MYSPERYTLIDYSHVIGDTALRWISKSPGKLPPVTNIIRIFDFYSWLMIGVSLLSFTAACLIFNKLSQSYGVVPPLDTTLSFFFPLAALTGEKMPRCFEMKQKSNKKSVFSPGFAGNGLLLLWTVMGSFLSMGFLSNIRAIILLPVYEDPIDSTEDIFQQGKIPAVGIGKSKVSERIS